MRAASTRTDSFTSTTVYNLRTSRVNSSRGIALVWTGSFFFFFFKFGTLFAHSGSMRTPAPFSFSTPGKRIYLTPNSILSCGCADGGGGVCGFCGSQMNRIKFVVALARISCLIKRPALLFFALPFCSQLNCLNLIRS